MKFLAARFRCALAIAIGFILLTFAPVWPGGSDDEAPDAHQDNGPNYFGFVKDTAGKVIQIGRASCRERV